MSRRSSLVRARTNKLFTLQQANCALPLVRRVVADIVAQYRELERLQLQRRRLSGDNHRDLMADLESKVAQGAQRLNDLIEEAGAIGCELKDWEHGLVDFRAIRNGREVYLCWKLGEDAIRYWHDLHAGAVGRRPIDASFQQGTTTKLDRRAR